jgi:hypothetical protein
MCNRTILAFVAAAALAAGCGKTDVEKAKDAVTESPEEKLERTGMAPVEAPGGARDERRVVGEVLEVKADFSAVTIKLPRGADVVVGDVFTVYQQYKPLPQSRYRQTDFKEMYLGKVQVTAVAASGCEAKVLHRVTDNPIRPGDAAVAKSY